MTDIVATNRPDDSVSVFHANGAGAWDGTFTTSAVAACDNPKGIRLGEVTGDAHLDVVVTCTGFAPAVLAGDGAGSFLPGVQEAAAVPLGSLFDVDGDGLLDLVGITSGNSAVGIALGVGAFGAPGSYFLAAAPIDMGALTTYNIAVADMDLDGDGDMVVTQYDGDGFPFVSVYQNSDSVFTLAARFEPFTEGTDFLRLGDVNGDLLPDIHLGTADQGILTYVSQSGQQGLAFSMQATHPNEGFWLYAFETADINGDGLLDFYTAGIYTGGNIAVRIQSKQRPSLSSIATSEVVLASPDPNDLAGGYLPPVSYPTYPPDPPSGGGYRAVELQDVTGDGILDLLIVGRASDGAGGVVHFHRGNGTLGKGDGTFTFVDRYPVGSSGYDVVTGDLNRDGLPDLVIAGSNTLALYYNTGGPGFANDPSVDLIASTVSSIERVSVADFNHDGVLDVVSGGRYIHFWPGVANPGAGSSALGTPVQISVHGVTGLQTADMNGDGALDLLFSDWGNLNGGGIFIQEVANGIPTGAFALDFLEDTGTNPKMVVTGDANDDGLPDMVVATELSRSLTQWLGQDSGRGSWSVPLSVDPTGSAAFSSLSQTLVTWSGKSPALDGRDRATRRLHPWNVDWRGGLGALVATGKHLVPVTHLWETGSAMRTTPRVIDGGEVRHRMENRFGGPEATVDGSGNPFDWTGLDLSSAVIASQTGVVLEFPVLPTRQACVEPGQVVRLFRRVTSFMSAVGSADALASASLAQRILPRVPVTGNADGQTVWVPQHTWSEIAQGSISAGIGERFEIVSCGEQPCIRVAMERLGLLVAATEASGGCP